MIGGLRNRYERNPFKIRTNYRKHNASAVMTSRPAVFLPMNICMWATKAHRRSKGLQWQWLAEWRRACVHCFRSQAVTNTNCTGSEC